MTKRVLVTGAAGFIGSHTVRHFARQGYRVIGLDRVPVPHLARELSAYACFQLPDDGKLMALLHDQWPDVCIHCAGSADVGGSFQDPQGDFEAGPQSTFALLNAIRQVKPDCATVFVSSAAVYGNPSVLPIPESLPCQPISPYGFHKWQSELICREFHQLFGLPIGIVRIFSAYGSGLRKQVVWDICRKASENPSLHLLGTGRESRDFMHVQDIVRAFECVIRHSSFQAEVYNLASGRETTIQTLAERLLQTLDRNIPLHFDGQVKAGTPLRWQANIDRLQQLGFQPEVDLSAGLDEVVYWFQQELSRV
jgi:UDP-glucose 4-epimerase